MKLHKCLLNREGSSGWWTATCLNTSELATTCAGFDVGYAMHASLRAIERLDKICKTQHITMEKENVRTSRRK